MNHEQRAIAKIGGAALRLVEPVDGLTVFGDLRQRGAA